MTNPLPPATASNSILGKRRGGDLEAPPAGVQGTAIRTPVRETMTELLPERPHVTRYGYAKMGNLEVPEAQYGTFRTAMIYLAKNPESAAIVKTLIDGPQKTDVIVERGEFSADYSGYRTKVRWDPKEMHVADNGAARSPAMRLGHELDHAAERVANPERHERQRGTRDPNFSTREEQRVIQGYEARTCDALGEGRRTDHGSGYVFEAAGVTSNVPVLKARRDGHSVSLSEGYHQDGTVRVGRYDVVQSTGRGHEVRYDREDLKAFGVDIDALKGAERSGAAVDVTVHGGRFQTTVHDHTHAAVQEQHGR